ADDMAVQVGHGPAAVGRLDHRVRLEESRDAGAPFAQRAPHRVLHIATIAPLPLGGQQIGRAPAQSGAQLDALALPLHGDLYLLPRPVGKQGVDERLLVEDLVVVDEDDFVLGLNAGFVGSASRGHVTYNRPGGVRVLTGSDTEKAGLFGGDSRRTVGWRRRPRTGADDADRDRFPGGARDRPPVAARAFLARGAA